MIRSYQEKTPVIPPSCYVDDSAQIIGDVILGEHASVWMNAVLRGDVHSIRVGAHSNVQDCSVLHGMKEQYGVFLGGYVTVGHSVTLHGCVVEDHCLIGMGSIILNGARIGAGSIIGAGTRLVDTYVGPYTAIGADCELRDAEIEHSVVLERSRIIGVHHIHDSLLGREVEVVRSGDRPKATRLMLGDHSRADLE